jgi:hypothetical protein
VRVLSASGRDAEIYSRAIAVLQLPLNSARSDATELELCRQRLPLLHDHPLRSHVDEVLETFVLLVSSLHAIEQPVLSHRNECHVTVPRLWRARLPHPFSFLSRTYLP